MVLVLRTRLRTASDMTVTITKRINQPDGWLSPQMNDRHFGGTNETEADDWIIAPETSKHASRREAASRWQKEKTTLEF